MGSALLLGGTKTERLTKLAGEIGLPADHDAPSMTAWLGALVYAVEGPAGDKWKAWNRGVKDGVKKQLGPAKNCDRGSWDVVEAAKPAGRVAATAGMTMLYETYYRWRGLEE